MAAWWTEAQIQARVDREFVNSKLHPQEQVVLDKPLAFGDGLTDDTYIDWILQKAKKLFLILLDIGVPDQVFGVIDDSFDDDDLPLSLDAVSQLKLSFQPDDGLNKKFYRTQFNYLVRHIDQGEHGRYGNDEVVPVEVVKRKADVLPNHSFEKVLLPGTSSKVFARRKISLGYASGGLPEEDFLAELDAMKAITHEHIMSLWASYTQDHTGYLLLTPAPEMSLKSFLTDVPQQFKMLPKQRRREVLLNWPHCLADALSFLHWSGLAHHEIRPSNVFVDSSNNIFFGDIGSLRLKGPPNRKKSTDSEAYEYAAPEHWVKTPVVHQAPPPRSTLPGGGRTGRKISVSSTLPSRRSSLISDVSSLASYDTSAAISTMTTDTSHSSSSNSSSSGSTAIVHKYRRLPTDPQRSDIFSLACIYLDILTHLLKRKHAAFASHRASKNRSAGRGGAPADASFHVNLMQVNTWIDTLDKAAFAKDDQLFRAVPPILALVSKMLARDPKVRPTATQVEVRLDDALFRFAHVDRPHCGTKHFADGDVGTRIGVAVSGHGGGKPNGGGGYADESGGGSRMTSALSLGSLTLTPTPMPSPSRRPSSKSSRSSGSTVRARTWPLGVGSSDEVLGHFMSHD